MVDHVCMIEGGRDSRMCFWEQNKYNWGRKLEKYFCSARLRVKLNTKIGLHTYTHPPHKLLGSNISAVTDPILIKLKT